MLQKPTPCVLSSHCWQVEGLLKPAAKVDPGVLHRESQVDWLDALSAGLQKRPFESCHFLCKPKNSSQRPWIQGSWSRQCGFTNACWVTSGSFQYKEQTSFKLVAAIKTPQGGTSLVVQWLRIHLPMQGMWVRSLFGELRSHIPKGN